MNPQQRQQFRDSLAKSNSEVRKYWAREIVDSETPLIEFLHLLDDESMIAQKFMWTIGDICELDPTTVAKCLPMLFEMRNEMAFPGMDRSVAKWLWLTRVPANMEGPAIAQLSKWLSDPGASIACKSYSVKALCDLVEDSRYDRSKLIKSLRRLGQHGNKAFASRMKKALHTLSQT